MRDGRATVTLSLDGGMCELRLKCRRLAHASSDIPLAFFEVELVEVRTHKAPYASVSGGVTFTFLVIGRTDDFATSVADATRTLVPGSVANA